MDPAELPHAPPGRPLWDRMEAERIARGLGRKAFAEFLGLARSTVDRLKSNPRAPQIETVKRVSERLDIEPMEAARLAGLAGGDLPSTNDLLAQAEQLASVLESEIARRIGTLSHRQQVELLRWLEQMGAAEQGESGKSNSA